MHGTVSYLMIGMGIAWSAEAFLGFRAEGFGFLYPFEPGEREVLGTIFLVAGSMLSWWEAKRADRLLRS